MGESNRISPEAPVPVVEIKKEEDRLGGAGNVVNNLLSLGANVLVAGVVGRDSRRLIDILESKGVDSGGIFIDESRETIIKSRVVVGVISKLLDMIKRQKEPFQRSIRPKILNYLKRI